MSNIERVGAMARWCGVALLAVPLATTAQQAPAPTPATTTQQQGAPAASPSAQDIIKALSAPRTRSMRNLGVVATPEAEAAAAPTAAPAPAMTAPAVATTPAPAPVPAPTAQAPARPTAVAVVAPSSPSRPAPSTPVSAALAPAPTRLGPATAAAAVAAGPAPSIDLAIQFAFNSNQVLPDSRKTLQALATALTAPELAGKRFLIEGHTDSAGLASYNARLSLARAEQVRFILIGFRVDAALLSVAGRGSSSPVNAGDPGAPENRRVRIISLEN